MEDHEQSVAGLRTVPQGVTRGSAIVGRGVRHRVLRWLLDSLGNPPVVITLWNGETLSPPGVAPAARVHFRRPAALWSLLADPWRYFGDLYARGDIEVEGDLIELLATVYRTTSGRRRGRSLTDVLRRPRPSSQRHARDNIHAHYDIGNAFYRLWLDRDMVYTCAYYPTADADLEAAQIAKMHHVCRKLALRPGERVIEAGCGWGSLALFMARHYGVHVRAYNISREQVVWARERARGEGLADRVTFIEEDYRNIKGECDAFVSVGMLEHVGLRYYDAFGSVIDRVLRAQGRGLIHTIGRARPGPMNAWIERRIFPGACPPSLGQLMQILEPRALAVLDVENLRLHYARTLRHWLERFEAAEAAVREMFDPSFVRMWRLYLCGSAAAFLTGELQLFQVLFNRQGCNAVAMTREHLHAPALGRVGWQAAYRDAANGR